MPFVVGLTGGTGSGKSSLRSIFERYGYVYIDTDLLARRVTDPNLPYLNSIIRVFGEKNICKDGLLDRHLLAKRAFSSPISTAVLNLLSHPAIIKMSLDIIDTCEEHEKIVIDAPLLFEAGMDSICDVIVAVTAPEEKRIGRIVKRDKITKEDAYIRLRRQHDDEFYKENADYILVNDSDFAMLESKAKKLLDELTVK